MPTITCKGPHGTRIFQLKDSAVLGRGVAADLVIAEETVSRRHARFYPEGGQWYVEDLGSGNGIAVNGVVVQGSSQVNNGDVLTVGKVEVRFDDVAESETRAHVIFESGEIKEPLRVLDSRTNPGKAAGSAATRRLQMVAESASAIARAVEEAPLFAILAERVFSMYAQADRTCIISVDEETGALSPRLALTRSGTAATIPVSRTLLGEVIGKRRGVVSADAVNDERFASGTMVGLSLRTVMCAPMVAGDVVLGAIQIDSADATRPFLEDDLAMLLALAAVTGVALANMRMNRKLAVQQVLAQDLALAKRVQRHFFPDAPPVVPRHTFESHYSPALGVGGDYYDFIKLSNTHYAVVVADVSGKGISAALCMAKLSSEMRFQCGGKTDAADILKRVNKAMVKELTDGMFVTMLLIVLNTSTGELQLVSAGHMGPFVRKANGELLQLPVPQNGPVGMPNYGGFEDSTFKLSPGDVVVMFTDGVSEGMNHRQEMFGEGRLEESVRKAATPTPAGIKDRILVDLEAFCQGADQNDDITLICFGPEK
ncbi:MAG TPA: SpoIIE family protein phosphatase [Thermoanaerobaculia bacterium]